jgi:hypothetical protein
MTKTNWVCSADYDCHGPFSSRRRPNDQVRAHDAGLCLMHRLPAFRSLTRKQRKVLGWSDRDAREWVAAVGPDARDEAQVLVDEYVSGGAAADDEDLDGPMDEEDRDGLYKDFTDGWDVP